MLEDVVETFILLTVAFLFCVLGKIERLFDMGLCENSEAV